MNRFKKLFSRSYMVNYSFENGTGRIFISSFGRVTQKRIGEWEVLIKSRNGLPGLYVTSFQRIKGKIH